jgi:RloB-like protein
LALSNPCFEVWLWLHIKSIEESTSDNCQKLKTEIHQNFEGGYKVEHFTKPDFYMAAISRAKTLDSNTGFMPEFKTTKVYQLLEELLDILN